MTAPHNGEPFLYFRMPRVASHSITRRVQRHCAVVPHSLPPRYVRAVLRQNECCLFRWTFVRHPFDRFMSAYRWATRKYTPRKIKPDQAEARLIEGLTAEDVATLLPELRDERHFIPQSRYLFDGDRHLFDFIGRFENLEGDFNEIAGMLGLKKRIKFGPNAKSPEGPTKATALLSERARAALADFYAEDFERLGYDACT